MRKIKRNIMRKEYGNKDLATYWAHYQIGEILDSLEKDDTETRKMFLKYKYSKSKRDGASAAHLNIINSYLTNKI